MKTNRCSGGVGGARLRRLRAEGRPRTADAGQRALATATVERSDAASSVEVDGTVVGATEAILVEPPRGSGRRGARGAGPDGPRRRRCSSASRSASPTAPLEGARAAVAAARSSWEIALARTGRASSGSRGRARPPRSSSSARARTRPPRRRPSPYAQAALARALRPIGRSRSSWRPSTPSSSRRWSRPETSRRPVARSSGWPRRRGGASRPRPAKRKPRGSPSVAMLPVILGDQRRGRAAIVEIVGAVDPATRRRTVRVDLPAGVEPPVGTFARLRLPGVARGEAARARERHRRAGRPRGRLGRRPRRSASRCATSGRGRPREPASWKSGRASRRASGSSSIRRPTSRPARGRRRDARPADAAPAGAERLGVAGRLAAAFIDSKLTPLLVLFALALGALAVVVTPREEEPQIKVPMIDVFASLPGRGAVEVERQVVAPLEKAFWSIPGVEYVYSTSSPGSRARRRRGSASGRTRTAHSCASARSSTRWPATGRGICRRRS